MTTRITGTIFFSPQYPGEKRQGVHYNEIIEGDVTRGHHDTVRTVFLDGTVAMVEVQNTDQSGVYIRPEGKEKDRIEFTRRGQPFIPPAGRQISGGFPIHAEVVGFGKVDINWEPNSPNGERIR